MSLSVTNSLDMQSVNTGSTNLQQSTGQNLTAPSAPTTASPEELDQLMSLLKADADGPTSTTKSKSFLEVHGHDLFVAMIIIGVVLIITVYRQLLGLFIKRT